MTDRKPFTVDEVVARLNELAARWPKDVELFSCSGSLALLPRDWRERVERGAIPSHLELAQLADGILNDGGDF